MTNPPDRNPRIGDAILKEIDEEIIDTAHDVNNKIDKLRGDASKTVDNY